MSNNSHDHIVIGPNPTECANCYAPLTTSFHLTPMGNYCNLCTEKLPTHMLNYTRKFYRIYACVYAQQRDTNPYRHSIATAIFAGEILPPESPDTLICELADAIQDTVNGFIFSNTNTLPKIVK